MGFRWWMSTFIMFLNEPLYSFQGRQVTICLPWLHVTGSTCLSRETSCKPHQAAQGQRSTLSVKNLGNLMSSKESVNQRGRRDMKCKKVKSSCIIPLRCPQVVLLSASLHRNISRCVVSWESCWCRDGSPSLFRKRQPKNKTRKVQHRTAEQHKNKEYYEKKSLEDISLDTDWLQVMRVKLREKVLGFATKVLSDLYVRLEFCLLTNQHVKDSSCSSVVRVFPPFGICRCASLAQRNLQRSRRARASLPTLKKVEGGGGGGRGESPNGVSSGRQRWKKSAAIEWRQKVETWQIQVVFSVSSPHSVSCLLYWPVTTVEKN